MLGCLSLPSACAPQVMLARLAENLDMRILGDAGEAMRISHSRGGAGGCRLDLGGPSRAATIPVLLHVAPRLRTSFDTFVDGFAEYVAPHDLERWCRKSTIRAA